MKTLQMLCLIVMIVGCLNWLLIGLFAFDLVAFLFGIGSMLSNMIYVLVGIAAIVYAGLRIYERN